MWRFLFRKSLFVPQPPELCNYDVWLITLITLSSFVGERCDWAEMRLIHYQWQVHPSVTRQMLFIHWLVLILLSDVFKSPCCKSTRGKSQDKTLRAGLHAAHIISELIFVKSVWNAACGRIQTALTFHMWNEVNVTFYFYMTVIMMHSSLHYFWLPFSLLCFSSAPLVISF